MSKTNSQERGEGVEKNLGNLIARELGFTFFFFFFNLENTLDILYTVK